MAMTNYKKWAIRLVLIVGLMATVATSAPDDHLLTATGETSISGPVSVRVFARFNGEALAHANEARWLFTLTSTVEAPFPITLVPDTPTLDPITIDIDAARARVGDRVALQGNLDPCVLYADPATIREQVRDVITRFGNHPGHVFNLGHGIHQTVDPDHLKVLVDAVHEFGRDVRD